MDGNAVNAEEDRNAEIQSDLEIAARGLLSHRLERHMEKYLVETDAVGKLRRISPSKRGTAESLCVTLRYTPEEAEGTLREYILHEETKQGSKKTQDGKETLDYLQKYIREVLDGDLFEILGMKWKDDKISGISIRRLLTPEEIIKYKLSLIISLLRFINREEKNDGR